LISTPHVGWITFQLEGTRAYELSYLTDIPMLWLDAAIHGLESLEPFCVTGFLEPMRMVCVVSYWNCHVFIEEDDDFEIDSNEVNLEHSHVGMLDFCRMLHDDVASDVESYASFMDWAVYDVDKEAEELRRKLSRLSELIDAKAEHFADDRFFY